jgi:hypothetical protein
MARGRTIGSLGQAFGPMGLVDHGFAPGQPGQPAMVRMQGVPTMPGYRDRPGKWNFARLPEWLRRLRQRPAVVEV